jgi:ParB-like chromosome segregation protein Spo0J
MTLELDEIVVPDGHRPYNAEAVGRLSNSIREIGLQYPITVVAKNNRFSLVAGRHRLEAFRVIGEGRIPAYVVKLSDLDARMWEISENLHRSELTVTQRAEQVAEYADLAKQKREAEVSRQVDAKPEGRPEGGNRAAARDLGLTEQEVRRAQKIAALPEETKEAARSLGYEDNQSALLAAAKERTPEEQIAALQDIAERGRVTPKPSARPLRDLIGISGGELARWIKITTPNDRPHVIRVRALNGLRGHLTEVGVIAPQGLRYALGPAELIEACDETIPFEVCEALAPLVVQLRNLDEAIAA